VRGESCVAIRSTPADTIRYPTSFTSPAAMTMTDGATRIPGKRRRYAGAGVTLAALILGLVLPVSACLARENVGRHAGLRELPKVVQQGALVRARLPPGSQLTMLAKSLPEASTAEREKKIRVAGDGRFVFGVGRDEIGPIRLAVTLPNKRRPKIVSIPVTAREWQIERVEGVPEATVNPPPEIAERIAREQAEVAEARKRDDDRDDFSAGFNWPLTGRVSGLFGSQRIYNGTPKSPHSGLDVAAPEGTPVQAPASGVISFARPDLYLTGGTVLLDHGHGLSSSFLHLSRIDVQVGDRIEQGQTIGLVGATGRATGPHMHWGLNWFDVRIDPQLLVQTPMPPAAPAIDAQPSR